MRGFEELLNLDPVEVSQRTFISVDEFKAIVDKRFELFGKTKATGFIKILEREYDLDLSDWMEEFEAYKKESRDENENIFVVAPKENDSIFENKLYVYSALGVVFLLVVFFVIFSGNNVQETNLSDLQSETVQEAKQQIEKKEKEEIQPAVTAVEPEEKETETPLPKDDFHITSNTKLWVGIQYLDNGKKESKIISGDFELDPTRDQILTLGHGHFKLTLNDQVIEPGVHNVHKITYAQGKLTVVKVPLPKKKEPAPVKEESPDEEEKTPESAPTPQEDDKVLEPVE
jgi:hypothetical protein